MRYINELRETMQNIIEKINLTRYLQVASNVGRKIIAARSALIDILFYINSFVSGINKIE